ncbi:MAG: AzlC family ABC transporter permease [Spirochaetaceae bacterium]|nr:AzlC family ABC transporter permease [Spirochaetaceae bacterium]
MTAKDITDLSGSSLSPRGFHRGLKDALPIIFGYFSASIAFGLLARSSSLTLWETQSFSLFTYTGAAQFMALNLINAGASGPQIVLSYGLLNLRYLLMSAAVAKKVDITRIFQRPLLAFGVTDENFAVTTGNEGQVTPAYQGAVELGPWIGWNLGTLSGWLFGSVLPASLSAAMVASLYALFMALLLPDLKKGLPWIITAASAAAANTVLELWSSLGSGWSFIIAMMAGTIVGMLIIPAAPDDRKAAA